jgi:hypothetical protein
LGLSSPPNSSTRNLRSAPAAGDSGPTGRVDSIQGSFPKDIVVVAARARAQGIVFSSVGSECAPNMSRPLSLRARIPAGGPIEQNQGVVGR